MVFDGVLIYEIDSIGFVHIIIHGSPEGDNHIFVEEFRIFTGRNFEHRDARLYLLAVHAFTELILRLIPNSIPSGPFNHAFIVLFLCWKVGINGCIKVHVILNDFNLFDLADFDTTRDCDIIVSAIIILVGCPLVEVSAFFEELTIHHKRELEHPLCSIKVGNDLEDSFNLLESCAFPIGVSSF